MSVSPIHLLVFTFSVTGFVGALSLLLRLNSSFLKAKTYFIAFILIQSLNILYAFLILTKGYRTLPEIIQTNHILQLVTPPIIYLFSYYLINPTKKNPRLLYIMLVPAIGLLFYFIPFYLQPDAVKIAAQYKLINGVIPLSHKLLFGLKTLSGITFITLAILELRKHEKNLFNFYGAIEDKTHNWLRNALFSFFIIWVSAISLRLLFNFETATTALALFVGSINWYLLFNFNVFIQPLRFEEEQEEESLVNATSQLALDNTNLEELTSYKEAFLKRVEEKKCFLHPNCNLTNFAEEVGFKSYIVSAILNKVLHTNFYDFINKRRAEEAANMLSNDTHNYLTVDAIGLECGFKSKATFYKSFKKMFNSTPSQYQKKHQ